MPDKRKSLESSSRVKESREEAVSKFRLETEHDSLAKHLHSIGILQSPHCTF